MANIEWDYEQSEYTKAEALYEIKEVMLEATQRARQILHGTGMTRERAVSYWLAHIEMALGDDHGYLGGDMFTMQSAIDELNDEGKRTDEPEDG